jgi:16S rRNA (guanine527-N7)-methyltransferase
MNRLLSQGIEALQQSDGDIARLIAGRLDTVTALLTGYTEEIERFNPAYGLVGAKDRQELVIKHILDSLAPLGHLVRLLRPAALPGAPGTDTPPPSGRNGGRADIHVTVPPLVADVGSGAGLPGIPLAIALPEVRFTLIERMGRRAGFLQNTLAVLGLKHVTVEECEMEKAPPGRFDMAVFRAFRPLEKPILKGLLRLLREGGSLAAYKGRREAVEAEMKTTGETADGWEILPCPVPFLEEERHLLVIHRDKAIYA